MERNKYAKEVTRKNEGLIELIKVTLPLILIMVSITYGTYFLLLGF